MTQKEELKIKLDRLNRKICCINNDINNLLSEDIIDALENATNPSLTNVFLTEEDLDNYLPQDVIDALTGANIPSALNPYATVTDIANIPDPITVVANYAALPAAATVTGEFYWAESSQGTQWLPGSLGGTYYPLGIYYSNGISWSHIETPYQATQLEVNAGSNDTKFVTPLTGQVAYAFKPGIAGGQTLIGGTGVSDALTLQGTSGNGTLTDKALRVLVGNAGATEAVTLLNNGDIGIGIVNPTARMHIVGPTLTSALATSALRITQTWNTTGSPTLIFANVTNTASGASANLMDLQVGGVSRFRVDKEGNVYSNPGEYRGGASTNFAFGIINGGFSGYFRIKQNYEWNGQLGTWMFDRTASNGNTSTSGNGAYVLVAGHFKPSSGTATYSSIGITDVINQTGGANGITRGLYVNPTLTAAADWRAIETNSVANSIVIGKNTGRVAMEVTSTTQGFLPPRMTTAQRDAIATVSGDAGLTIFNTTTTKLECWDGAAWQQAW